MSLVEQYHVEHKARLARMSRPKPAPQPAKIQSVNPEPFYRGMWFWDLVTYSPKPDAVTRPQLRKIAMVVAANYGLTLQEMMSRKRTKDIVVPRQVAMFLACKLTLRSLPEIGRFFCHRDHTTVLHARRRIESMSETLRDRLEVMTSEILAP